MGSRHALPSPAGDLDPVGDAMPLKGHVQRFG